MGAGLRTVHLTSAAPAADQSGWWLGTDGAGLYWLPFGSTFPEQRSWGLPGEEVGGVYAVPGGAWAVTDRTIDGDAALVFAPNTLDRFDWFGGDRVFGHPFREVRVVHAVDSLIWVGTDQGAFAFDRGGRRVRAIDEHDGLADRRILSIAARRGRIVLGTVAGVAEVTDSGAVRLAPTFTTAALALALSGDTTWVGTTLGLFADLPGMTDLRQAPGWEGPALQLPVTALLWRGDTLVALTDHGVVWRDPANSRWTIGPEIAPQVGRTHALADGNDGVWIAGSLGLAFARINGPIERVLAVGDALPGEAWDVSIDGDRIWVATPHGLVRFRRQGVEP
jgi:ligand-binding sensor domain-containing protein